MYVDDKLLFGIPADGGDSTDVHDAGAAVLMFAAPNAGVLIAEGLIVAADDAATIKIDLIGSDEATLDTNIIIASSGVITADKSGTALGTSGIADIRVPVGYQTHACQYYGLIVTLGGTNATCTAAPKQGFIALSGQTNPSLP